MQIVSCLELGGTEAFIMNNYRVLNRSEYQFDFAVFCEKDYPYSDEINQLGGHIYFVGTPSFYNIHKCNISYEGYKKGIYVSRCRT